MHKPVKMHELASLVVQILQLWFADSTLLMDEVLTLTSKEQQMR